MRAFRRDRIRMTHSWFLAREHERLPEGSSDFAPIGLDPVDPRPISGVFEALVP